MVNRNNCMGDEEPQIVEVPRFVSSSILKSHDLPGGDFVEAIHGNWTVFWYVLEFSIGAQDGKLLHREEQNLRDRNVNLDCA